jgi:cell pole-organizing protein PopZ
MEEILASIRRIIADDGGAAAQAGARPAAAPAAGADLEQGDIDALMERDDAPAESEVLELTQPVEAGPAFTPVRGPDVVFREERPAPAAAPARPAPAAAAHPPPPAQTAAPARRPADDRLLSPSSTAAVSAAFNSLASTVLSDNARTLEDIVKEMMRPMLREWLEENLPGLVERIVRAEIERVARGGR